MVVQSGGGARDANKRRAPLKLAQQLLTVREAAALLKVSTATVYKLVHAGELEHVRVGNSIRVVRKG